MVIMTPKDPHHKRIEYTQEEAELFKKHNCKKLLEIFFGEGNNLLNFKKDGFQVQGIDDGKQQQTNYLDKGKALAKKHHIHIDIQPVFKSKLPYEDNSFDGVYAWQFINHNHKENIIMLFKEIHRVLKPKGIFSLRFTKAEDFKYKQLEGDLIETIESEQNKAQGFAPEKMRLIDDQTIIRLIDKEKNIPHYMYFKQELREDLEKIGFKIVDIKEVLWNWHVWAQK
jgi:SAM-dependent methyltransferase